MTPRTKIMGTVILLILVSFLFVYNSCRKKEQPIEIKPVPSASVYLYNFTFMISNLLPGIRNANSYASGFLTVQQKIEIYIFRYKIQKHGLSLEDVKARDQAGQFRYLTGERGWWE